MEVGIYTPGVEGVRTQRVRVELAGTAGKWVEAGFRNELGEQGWRKGGRR